MKVGRRGIQTYTLKDASTIDLEQRGDDRGFFARALCERELADRGLEERFVKIYILLQGKRGTLKGLHYQLAPAALTKIIRFFPGAFWDAIINLHPDSPTFGQWFGRELSAQNRRTTFVSRGFAREVLTLEDDTELLYLVSEFYEPTQEPGVPRAVHALPFNGLLHRLKSPTST